MRSKQASKVRGSHGQGRHLDLLDGVNVVAVLEASVRPPMSHMIVVQRLWVARGVSQV